MEINTINWGLIPYGEAYAQQKRMFDQAIQQKTDKKKVTNHLIFCEHPHVITLGKNASSANLLLPEKSLQEKQIEVVQTDRGGDITYHGPGQIVVYPIFDLEQFGIGLKEYIYRLEEVIIRTINHYGITGERMNGATGVWIDPKIPHRTRKIAAIGVRCSRYVTMHGFALNVNTDLSYFRTINPCGFTDKGVTSLQAELGRLVDMDEVRELVLREAFYLSTKPAV